MENGSLKKIGTKQVNTVTNLIYGYIRIECHVFSRETNIHNVQGDYVNLLPRMSMVGFIEVDKCYKVITKTVSTFLSYVYFFT